MKSIPLPKPSGGGRGGVGEYPEGMRSGDLDAMVQGLLHEGGVEGLHRREQGRYEEPVPGGEDLVSHEDSDDVCGVGVREDVASHPFLGDILLCQPRDLVRRDTHGDCRPCVAECAHRRPIAVEESHAVDAGGVCQESGHLCRRREVVRHPAVVDADQPSVHWRYQTQHY